MVLGNFLLLTETHPENVYRWFMEFFIDAYDWVMIPNVYGMSQYADGGVMITKPYIAGSNYLKKMGDYASGPWEEIFDSLYWNFVDKNQTILSSIPRSGMMVSLLKRMPESKHTCSSKDCFSVFKSITSETHMVSTCNALRLSFIPVNCFSWSHLKYLTTD